MRNKKGEKQVIYDTPTKTLPDGRTVYLITRHTKFDFGGGEGPIPAHRHGNGGGWVANSVEVSESIYIGRWARVRGGTIRGGEINGGTIMGGTIRGGTIMGGTIRGGEIMGGTIMGGTIWGGEIMGGTIMGGTINGGTIWGGEIRGGTIMGGTIRGGKWKTSPIQIQGSRDFVCQSSATHVAIGCCNYPLTEWLERYEEIGRKNNYSESQIAEYGEYLQLISRIVELRKPKEGAE